MARIPESMICSTSRTSAAFPIQSLWERISRIISPCRTELVTTAVGHQVFNFPKSQSFEPPLLGKSLLVSKTVDFQNHPRPISIGIPQGRAIRKGKSQHPPVVRTFSRSSGNAGAIQRKYTVLHQAVCAERTFRRAPSYRPATRVFKCQKRPFSPDFRDRLTIFGIWSLWGSSRSPWFLDHAEDEMKSFCYEALPNDTSNLGEENPGASCLGLFCEGTPIVVFGQATPRLGGLLCRMVNFVAAPNVVDLTETSGCEPNRDRREIL